MSFSSHLVGWKAGVAAILLASTAFAQNTDTATSENSANTGNTILPSISVTATRNAIDAFEFPGMVSVIGRRGVQDIQSASPDDILRYTPGIDFNGGPRRTGEVPSIRGFSNDDVIILLDGARQNYISGHDGRFFVDPFFLRQIEVVKGSSSALYGSGGTGGVIELRTVEASDVLAKGKKYGFQSIGGYQAVNREWNTGVLGVAKPYGNLELLGGVVYRNSEDLSIGDDATRSTLSSQDRITSGLFKGKTTLAENHVLDFSWQRFTNLAVEPNNGQSGTASDLTNKDANSDNFRVAYNYAPPSNPWVDLTVLTNYTNTEVKETAVNSLSTTSTLGDEDDRILKSLGFRADNRSRINFRDDILGIFTYGLET